VSRCDKCGVDYDRNRPASLAILLRGLRLCGQPFAVSAGTSWQLLRDEYLYTPALPRAGGQDGLKKPPSLLTRMCRQNTCLRKWRKELEKDKKRNKKESREG